MIRDLFHAIDAGAWTQLDRYFTPDIVYERPGYAPLQGFPAVLHFYREVRIVGVGRHDLQRIVVAGDAIACWGRFTGCSRKGEPLDERFCDTYTVRQDRLATRATYFFRAAI